MRIATLVTCLVSTLWAPMAAQAQAVPQSFPDIPQLVASARGTVVLLKAFDRRGQVLGLGSGFRIAGGRFVTNAHVVAGASRVEIFDDGGALLGIARYAEVLSTTVDLAILPALAARTPALPLAGAPPPVGEPVIVIGAPEGLANTVSNGIVSAIRKVEFRQLLQITAPISPGSSGGPVINRRGEVVGVSVSILREGQNLNFAVPVADVAALVASHPGQFEFPPSLDESERGSSRSERSGRATGPRMPGELLIGRNASGTLTAEDRLSNGIYVDYYRLAGIGGNSVSIWVGSADFDPLVAVFRMVGDSVVRVTFDDDSGGGLNAKAMLTFSSDVTYFVAVSAANGSASKLGDYVVRVEAAAVADASGATPGEAQARWLYITTTTNSRFEFDRTRITPAGYQAYFAWVRTTYTTPFKDESGYTSDVILLQYQVSCSDSRIRLRSGIKYLRGEVVKSGSFDGPWEAAVPESIGETTVEKVCRYAKNHGL